MQAKNPLLKLAASLVAIAALTAAGCATNSTTPSASTAAANASTSGATAAEAQAYVDAAETELKALYERVCARLMGVFQLHHLRHRVAELQRSDAEATATLVRLASGAGALQGFAARSGTAPQARPVALVADAARAANAGAADRLSELTTRMASIYSTSRIEYQGRQVPLDELEVMMGEMRNPAQLQEIWTKWHAIAAPMRAALRAAWSKSPTKARATSASRCRPDVAVELRHAARRDGSGSRAALAAGAAALRTAALLCAQPLEPALRQRSAAARSADPRRSARQYVGAELGRHLCRSSPAGAPIRGYDLTRQL